jgi:hypothetical protein
MASATPSTANRAAVPEPRSWIERLWSSIADRGHSYAEVLQPKASKVPLDRARELATALLSERGEASGAAVARELQLSLHELGTADRVSFYRFLVENFLPAEAQLRAAAEAYLAEPTPERATQLAKAAEPTRQELLRRMNMAPGGTAALVAMRKDLLSNLRSEPALKPLDSDLRCARHFSAGARGRRGSRRSAGHRDRCSFQSRHHAEAVEAESQSRRPGDGITDDGDDRRGTGEAPPGGPLPLALGCPATCQGSPSPPPTSNPLPLALP